VWEIQSNTSTEKYLYVPGIGYCQVSAFVDKAFLTPAGIFWQYTYCPELVSEDQNTDSIRIIDIPIDFDITHTGRQ
jgi:hypothetical protein